MNQILQDDINFLFPKWNTLSSKERGTSATSRYNNGQAQVLFQIVFLPYIARCGVYIGGGETRHFEELDKMYVVGSTLVGDFQVEMHFTSMCVKYLIVLA
jgi:hypothetical protein